MHIAYSRKENGVVELQSLNFPKRAQFHVREIPEEKVGDWVDHMRGVAKQLAERYGISAAIEKTLPIEGLSSSAAMIIAFLSALARENRIELDPERKGTVPFRLKVHV